MKKTIVYSVLALSALTAFNAQADGRWPNWYVGLHGSLNFVSDADLEDNPVVDSYSSNQGFGYGVSLGYRPATNNKIAKNFRLEAEWLHQGADVDKVDSPFGSFNGSGETRVNAGMANLFYDFVMIDQNSQPRPFAPYLGAGLGWANVKFDGTDTSFGNVADSDDVFAWQLMAGVNYAPQFLPFTEWSLGYRYFDTAESELSYIGGGTFKTDYTSHNIEAGVRFLF